MDFVTFIVVALIALAVFIGVAQHVGKRTVWSVSHADPQAILDAAERCFGSLWVETSGPGQINMRRKALRERGRSVVSVSVEPSPQGSGSVVSVWMSQGTALVEMADAMVVRGIQNKVMAAVAALPAALPRSS